MTPRPQGVNATPGLIEGVLRCGSWRAIPLLGQRDIDGVLRSLNRDIPHAVINSVDSHPWSRSAPVPVFASDGASNTSLGELMHARTSQAA
jgi:hypothetical protein